MRRELCVGTPGQTGLGEQLRIKQFACGVVGVLTAKGQGGMGDQDDTALLGAVAAVSLLVGGISIMTSCSSA